MNCYSFQRGGYLYGWKLPIDKLPHASSVLGAEGYNHVVYSPRNSGQNRHSVMRVKRSLITTLHFLHGSFMKPKMSHGSCSTKSMCTVSREALHQRNGWTPHSLFGHGETPAQLLTVQLLTGTLTSSSVHRGIIFSRLNVFIFTPDHGISKQHHPTGS